MKDKPQNITGAIRQSAYIVRAVRGPIQSFIHTEEVGALFLLVAASAALVWINSPWSASYVDFWHIEISFDIHVFAISEDLRHLVNEGLMAVFFFVVGLEIKRELVHGELSTFRKAILPVVAAVGGMSAPAVIYVLFNYSGDYLVGWGIPMATDIAFAVGILALLGRRVPTELRVFLLGLAIVDDLGAIGVIAAFYTEAINWTNLGLGVGFFIAIALCVRFGIRSIGFYLVMCVVMWLFFLESGIHATLAGVLIATIVPSKPDLSRNDSRLPQRNCCTTSTSRWRERTMKKPRPSLPRSRISAEELKNLWNALRKPFTHGSASSSCPSSLSPMQPSSSTPTRCQRHSRVRSPSVSP